MYIYSDIPIPLYEPACCNSCFYLGSLRLICGPTRVAVIIKKGRFDVTATQFVCSVCNESRLATNKEYMFSGYCPASLSDNSYFIEEDLLSFWHHLRHKKPGTSERKFVETLDKISLDNDRVNLILRT